jgi:hypothetical protein
MFVRPMWPLAIMLCAEPNRKHAFKDGMTQAGSPDPLFGCCRRSLRHSGSSKPRGHDSDPDLAHAIDGENECLAIRAARRAELITGNLPYSIDDSFSQRPRVELCTLFIAMSGNFVPLLAPANQMTLLGSIRHTASAKQCLIAHP